MNESFARYPPPLDEVGNDRGGSPIAIAKIKKICGQSFANSLLGAMEQTNPPKKMTWRWKQTLSEPKLTAFFCLTVLAGQPESDLCQAVVRIHGQEVQCYDVIASLTVGIG